jgi:succinate dehydrogenase/fumarate reductase flavoprotein subunit
LTNGNALAARLLRTAIDTNVKLWSGTPAVEIQPGPDRQWRVTIEKDGQRRTLVARRALVIASGGFGSDPAMSERYIPMAADGYTLQPSENRGDGIRMGVAAGAVFEPHLVANAIGTPIYAMPGPDGTPLVFPSLLIDRYGPGSIIVNQAGKRFVDESSHYHRFMAEMNVHKTPIAYLIANHAFQRRYGLGISKPAPFPIGKYLRNGHLVSARTLPELAAKLGINPTALVETVKRFDGNASRGVDPDFNRGGNAYSTFLGDQSHKPNPNLGPVGEGPYLAVRIYPGNYSTLAGLETNASAQILDAKGDPIAGLYAVGIDMAPVFNGTYPGGGTSLGPALTFGYITANHIVSAAGRP